MKTLKYLLQKEFKQIFRNQTILRMIFAIPIIQLLILPLAADYEIKNINIAIVDNDHSTYAQKLTQLVTASGYFKLVSYGQSYKESFKLLEDDKADLILEIPNAFERKLVRENQAALFISVNAINGVKANIGGAYLGGIIASFNNSIRKELAVQQNTNVALQMIQVENINRFNRLLNYKFFMVPGILVVLVTLVGMIMSALNIVAEKEKGTIEQINVTPIKKLHFILGKLIPFWLIGNFVFTLGLLGVARIVYGIIPAGNVGVLYLFLALYLIAVLGVGLLISTFSATQQQAMSVAFFIMMVFMLMSGLFTPIESMPEWAQWIARFNPVTYFIEVMRMVVMKGSGLQELKDHFLIMGCFAVVTNTWAIINYKKTS